MKQTPSISNRLKQVAGYLLPGSHFADIGSDHAYLPCYVCLKDPQARAIAGEINPGPMESAQQTVTQFRLNDAIDIRQGYGLDVISENEVDTIVISGMGGILISSILASGQTKLSSVKRMIIQPNNEISLMRDMLAELGFKIIDEAIIKEQGHFYEMMVAVPSVKPINLCSRDKMFGPILRMRQTSEFHEKWIREHQKLTKAITEMQKAKKSKENKINHFKTQLQLIEEVLGYERN